MAQLGSTVVNGDLSITGSLNAGAIEQFTIAANSWSAISGVSPFAYKATVTASHTITANSTIELIADNPVAFANYCFCIGTVSAQSITLYCINKPSSSQTLIIRIS